MASIKQNKPLLNIVIPTYNRINQIQRQVRCLLPQLNDDVKLVVYDNCSPIPVRSLFTEIELSQFEIIENLINIGADANILRCLEMSQSKWVWTLGDDDYASPTAVDDIFAVIRKYPNAIWYNFNHHKDVVLNNFEDFAEDNKDVPSLGDAYWISKCVYNIEILRPSLLYYYRYLSSMIGQFLFVLKHVELNNKCVLVRTKTQILKETTVGEWGFNEYIRYALISFDAFERNKRCFLRKNVLKALTKFCLSGLITMKFTSNRKEIIYLFKITIAKFGFWNTIINFPLLFFCNLIALLLPPKILKIIIIKMGRTI
jgi:glycosyltransferase involved in cell wall biosynthesis